MRPRTLPTIAGLAVLAVLGLALAGPSAGIAAQDEIVARGNQAYQEEDYAAAIEAYEAVRAAGFQSAGLEYNLGNAHFKAGDLGRAILHWERALALAPGDPDARANLELARTLTVDAVEPLPTFWLVSAVRWWVGLVPRGALVTLVSLAWLALAGAIVIRVLTRRDAVLRVAHLVATTAGVVVIVLGANLVVRELEIGRSEHAIVMVDVASVRSAPAADDDLVLFEIHEGTRVRIDQRTGAWAEVVLDDGKVGWLPSEVMETI